MNYTPRYVKFLGKHTKIRGLVRVVLDCSDGTTGPIVRSLLENHPRIRAWILNARPNGRFPAHGPDPWKRGAMGELKANIKKRRADLGIIFDADGDRVFFLDDKARVITPDIATALLSKNVQGSVLLDVRMGFLIRKLLKKRRVKVIDSRVGHTFVKQTMREQKAAFGAEMSGHYYFKKFFYADSGIFATVKILSNVSRLNEPLSDYIDSLPKYFQSGEQNFEVQNKDEVIQKIINRLKRSANKVSFLDGVRMEFKTKTGEWWFGIRASNTQDFLRLNVEATNKKLLEEQTKRITNLIRGFSKKSRR